MRDKLVTNTLMDEENIQALQKIARHAATATIFQIMASPEKSEELLNQIKSFSDEQLNMMAELDSIPDSQRSIYRAQIRGEDNELIKKLGSFDSTLKTGDLILMTGKSKSSAILTASQKTTYPNARSSHIAVVHAEFICVDAMPVIGVTNRLISEVLADAKDDWRVIRFNNLEQSSHETLQKVCAYYLAQPYKIFITKKPGKSFSYCSELARKIYFDSKIPKCGIPKSKLIKPCDFDRLADKNCEWTDITDKVRPFIDFCKEYEAHLRVTAKLFIYGLKLNRKRAEERIDKIRHIRRAEKNKIITSLRAKELISDIHTLENSMNFSFWDSVKNANNDLR